MRSASSCIAFLALTSTLSLLTSAQSNAFIHIVELGDCPAGSLETVTVGISANVDVGLAAALLTVEFWASTSTEGVPQTVDIAVGVSGQVELFVRTDTTTFAADGVVAGGMIMLLETDGLVKLDCVMWGALDEAAGSCPTVIATPALGDVYHLTMMDATKNVGEFKADY
eukprot:Selendium_serpulae@DN6217_c4_g1_i1.p1